MKAVRVGEILQICIILALSMMVTSCGEQANEHGQGRDIKKPKGDPTKGNVVGMPFVRVAEGTFKMGADREKAYFSQEKPVHEVTITKPFWIGKYEVAQSEYKKLLGEKPSKFKGNRKPVERVSWKAAVKFCEKLTKREGRGERLPEGYVYRLPTEVEWEYAARGGQKSEGYKYSGSDEIDEVAWYGRNSGEKRLTGEWDMDKIGKIKENNSRTHKVGTKVPNELGIHDMSGNVWEWCYDWYNEDYYSESPREDPVNTSEASLRVRRGGGWGNLAQGCHVASRFGNRPNHTSSGLGFRVVLGPEIKR